MIFLGKEISQQKDYSERTAEIIDEEVHRSSTAAYERALHHPAGEPRQAARARPGAARARDPGPRRRSARILVERGIRGRRRRPGAPAAGRPRHPAGERRSARYPRRRREPGPAPAGSPASRSGVAPTAAGASPAACGTAPDRAGRAHAGDGGPQLHPRFLLRRRAAPSTPGRGRARADELAEEGADWIDVGGESTRPGAEPVSVEEEWRRDRARSCEAARRLASRPSRSRSTPPRPRSRARALDAGAVIVNDVSGLRFDPRWPDLARRSGAALILMHMRGEPRTMQQEPVYEDVVGEVGELLRGAAAVARAAGSTPSQHPPRSGNRLRQDGGAQPRDPPRPAGAGRAGLPGPRGGLPQELHRADPRPAGRRTGWRDRWPRTWRPRWRARTWCGCTTCGPRCARCGWPTPSVAARPEPRCRPRRGGRPPGPDPGARTPCPGLRRTWSCFATLRRFATIPPAARRLGMHLQAFRWVLDVLDILIVAFLFYHIFLLVRGTRAAQMFLRPGRDPRPDRAGRAGPA